MTEIEPVRLSADGFPACAQPEQMPRDAMNGLMKQYLEAKNNPNVVTRSEPLKDHTNETLTLDGKVLFQAYSVTVEQNQARYKALGTPAEAVPKETELHISQPDTGRIDRYIGDDHTSATFHTKDANGRDVVTEAQLQGAKINSEFIWWGSDTDKHDVSYIQLSEKGTPKGVICMDKSPHTTYTYHQPWETRWEQLMQDVDVFANKTYGSQANPWMMMPF
jgi:hypothetical protein